ncbi:MAG: S8 family serine peptidase [Rubrivivax sp.]|nr:S8 family serine peptidase [Rubrivivax sp.]
MAKKAAAKPAPKSATPRATAPRRAKPSRKTADGSTLPPRLFAQVSPRSIGGLSMFDYDGPIDGDIVSNFCSEEDTILRAAQALQDAGFDILQLSPYTINVAAPIATFERAFKSKISPHEISTRKSGGVTENATFFSGEDTGHFGLLSTQGTSFENLIEGVAIEEPRYYFATSPYAPRKAYWHLDVPHDVSLGTNADKAHRGGITGRGIRVAMVDSGHFAHPFFTARGYRVQAVTLGPGAANAAADENGHGTAESANIFAVAPDAELLPVKMNFANSTGAFNAAVALNPHIITCSWGSDLRSAGPLSPANQALAIAIADAVARGIVVIFSAGNGHFGFPGQHPDVISAGGAFLAADGSLRASDYASGFASPIYPGRNAPDLCGLVGMRPRAAYIMLPLQPACTIDTDLAGGAHPNADETPGNDGWAAISGTSAAAPQLAGAAALVKQACARLTPAEVRDVLVRTAVDVTTGICNPASSGAAAVVGTDLATGAGLVDANAAVLVAKVRCLGPIRPITPIGPIQPIQPIQPIRPPITPITPVAPITPVRPPITPVTPIRPPVTPIRPPVTPIRPPVTPVVPVRPPIRPPVLPQASAPDAATPADLQAAAAGSSLTAEDVAALEELVIKGKLDPMA